MKAVSRGHSPTRCTCQGRQARARSSRHRKSSQVSISHSRRMFAANCSTSPTRQCAVAMAAAAREASANGPFGRRAKKRSQARPRRHGITAATAGTMKNCQASANNGRSFGIAMGRSAGARNAQCYTCPPRAGAAACPAAASFPLAMPAFLHCPAVLALELPPGAVLARRHLDRSEAERCAALIAEDLRRLLPGAEAAHLGFLGALYDAAQLLRPGFPVLATRADLSAGGIGKAGQAQVIAYGCRSGAVPTPDLEPLTDLGNGPMLLLPFTLIADAALADTLGTRMESEFLARGEAGAALSDFLMRTLGAQLEHARDLTRHDLCALT